MIKKINIIIIVLLIAAILIAGIILYQWKQFIATPLVTQSQVFDLTPGTNLHKLTDDLSAQGIIKHPLFFKWLARVRGDSHRLKAGEYQVDAGITPDNLLTKFVRGEVILHHFTIVEGWTFQQILKALAADQYLKHTLDTNDSAVAMDMMELPGINPEGRFYPDTYFFAKGVPDRVILTKAYARMQEKLHDAWQTRALNLPYKTSYEALIVASMIEKETALVEEKPLIAGVIINRLAKNMRLQIDPTVIYGLGKNYDGSLSRADLKQNTQYNTYRHKGLPPTPICMPSISSIMAALHPAETSALYYVAKGDGSHIFSETLKDHDIAIKKYLLVLDNKKDSAERDEKK